MIVGTVPELILTANGKPRLVILQNNGAVTANVGYDYNSVASGRGFQLAAGASTTQIQVDNELWAMGVAQAVDIGVVSQ